MQLFPTAEAAIFWASEVERYIETGQVKRAKEGPERPCAYSDIFQVMRRLRYEGVINASEFMTVKFFGRTGRRPDKSKHGARFKEIDERRASRNWDRAMPAITKALIAADIVELPPQAIQAAA